MVTLGLQPFLGPVPNWVVWLLMSKTSTGPKNLFRLGLTEGPWLQLLTPLPVSGQGGAGGLANGKLLQKVNICTFVKLLTF